MTDGERPAKKPASRTPPELAGARIQAIRIFMFLSVAIVLAHLAGRPVDSFIVGATFGTLLMLLGFEGISRVLG